MSDEIKFHRGRCLYGNKPIKGYSRLGLNKHGNESREYKLDQKTGKRKFINHSLRPVYSVGKRNKLTIYFIVQNADLTKLFDKNNKPTNYRRGLWVLIKAGQFGALPEKDSIICLDTIFLINSNGLENVINQDNDLYTKTNNAPIEFQIELLKFVEQKLFKEHFDDITIVLTDYKRLSTTENFNKTNNPNYTDPFNIGKTLVSNVGELNRENNDPNNINKEPNLNHKILLEKITRNLDKQNEMKIKCLEMIKDIRKELEQELELEKQKESNNTTKQNERER